MNNALFAGSSFVVRARNALGALAMGGVAGYVCSRAHTPIPWMLGPLFALAVARLFGSPLAAPPGARQTGQWIVGTSLGLYFTPTVVRGVVDLWPVLIAAAAFAIAVGYLAGVALARLAKVDRTTAVFASVPGGAAEMATLGERFGARVDQVAAAQSLRLVLVVMILPAAYAALGMHGRDPYVSGSTTFVPGGFALLMTGTLIGGVIAQRLRLPNAFVLGSLAVAIPLTAAQINLSALPQLASNTGQCLLGCALGSRFGPEFLRGAHRFVAAVAVTVLLGIALSAGFGAVLAWMVGQDPATLVLGTAPGGIAEMCITAKVLELGVPLVTACHVTRVVVLLLATAPLFARAKAMHAARKLRQAR